MLYILWMVTEQENIKYIYFTSYNILSKLLSFCVMEALKQFLRGTVKYRWLCEIWCSYSVDYWEFSMLGYDTWNIFTSLSEERVTYILRLLFYPEYCGSEFLWNVSKHILYCRQTVGSSLRRWIYTSTMYGRAENITVWHTPYLSCKILYRVILSYCRGFHGL